MDAWVVNGPINYGILNMGVGSTPPLLTRSIAAFFSMSPFEYEERKYEAEHAAHPYLVHQLLTMSSLVVLVSSRVLLPNTTKRKQQRIA